MGDGIKGKRILYASDIATVLGWTTDHATRWLKRPRNDRGDTLGFLDGGRWATTRNRLMELCPPVWDEMRADLDTDDGFDDL
jgi:hypothetical protein